MSCEGWRLVLPICQGKAIVSTVFEESLKGFQSAILEAAGKAVGSLGTFWVRVKTPDLTDGGSESAVAAGSSGPDSGNITTVLGYVMWVCLALAVLSLVFLAMMLATRLRSGEGLAATGRLGIILGGVTLLSGGSALVAGLLQSSGPTGVGGAALFLQSSLWWYTGAAAVLSVIIGGARMAWEQRAEPGRETVKSLFTLVVVAGAGVTIVNLLVEAADGFSVWILESSLKCDLSPGSACFGNNIMKILNFGKEEKTVVPVLLIILGLLVIIVSLLQILVMIARSGMLVILAGVLPLTASMTNTEIGKGWFKKATSWLVAFILYKPAAAIIYAAAFQLAGQRMGNIDAITAVLTGLMLMLLAIFAMPALIRFVTPVAAMAGGGAGAALAAGAAAMLPTGAAPTSGRSSSSETSHNSSQQISLIAQAPTGAGSSGPTGQRGHEGTSGTSASQANPAHSGGGGNAPVKARHAATDTTTSGATSATGAGATGFIAVFSGGAAAGKGAGTAAGKGAGAAGGPVGAAASTALEVGQAVGNAARNIGEQATAEGPDGSR